MVQGARPARNQDSWSYRPVLKWLQETPNVQRFGASTDGSAQKASALANSAIVQRGGLN